MNREEYRYYLEEDNRALRDYKCPTLWPVAPFYIDKEIGRFQYILRTCEYLYSIKSKNPILKLIKYIWAEVFKRQSIKLGFTIPVNVCGPGLRILHRGTIVINGKCKIGKNCTINAGVNIGIKAGCAIGANAVVCNDVLVPNSIVVGVPAKVIGTVTRDLSA